MSDKGKSKGIPINPKKNRGRPPKRETIINHYRKHPDEWIENVFNEKLWDKQREIFLDVWNNRYTVVKSCYASGKCVGEDERLILLDGSVVEAKKLRGSWFDVLAFDESTNKMVPARAYASDNGVKPVWKIVTKSGRTVVRTGEHPFYAAKVRRKSYVTGTRTEVETPAWVRAEDLTPGHAILAPHYLPLQPKGRMPEDHVKLAAYLLAEGGITHSTITFTNKDDMVMKEFRDIVERLGCETHPVTTNPYEVRVAGKNQPNGRRYAAQNHTNHVLDLVREWGMYGQRSRDKRFPEWVWNLPDDQLALFLNRFFTCDGWAYAKENGSGNKKSPRITQLGIALASKGLIEDIQLAFWRLGIQGVSRYKRVARKYDAWEWSCTSRRDILRFADVVGAFGRKAEDLAKCVEVAANKRERTWWLDQVAPEGFFWDPVVSVERISEQPTVSISVPGYETFVTTLVEHNSYLAACLVLAWVHLWEDSVALTTASSGRQVRNNVWQVIHYLKQKSNIPLGSEFLQTKIRCRPGWYAEGFATDDPGNIQGVHPRSGKLLVIVDESAEVDAAIHERIPSALLTSEGAHILHIGNPLETGTMFHSYFNDPKYVKHTISAFDTPNVKEGRVVIPGLVTRTWVEERRAEWGEDSPLWYSRVLGEFPPTGNDTLIPLSWIIEAQKRWHDMSPEGREVAGVDIARYGDSESVCCLISGRYVHPLKTWHNASTSESVGYIRMYAGGARVIRVDEIGVGGGVVDQAKQEGLPVVGINVQTRSSKPEKFFNLRSELYWNLREMLDPENPNAIALPPDDTLASQLSSIKYKIVDSGGKIKVESKDEMRSRGLKSPDRADALALAAANVLSGGANISPVLVGVSGSYWMTGW